MEPKFQTSFIPKRPLVAPGTSSGIVGVSRPRRSTSLFMALAVILFAVSLVSVGGVYAWSHYLVNLQGEYKKDLANKEKQFNIDLIEQLKQENVKIETAKQLLNSHIAISQLFEIVSHLTTESVRFLSMSVVATPNDADGVKIQLSGYGSNLAAVAFQSDVLGQLEQYGLRKVIKNPILSDPTLDAKGTVSFNFGATLDAASLSYKKSITGSAVSDARTGSTTNQ